MIYPRQIEPKFKEYLYRPEIMVLTGMRQVGKTTLIRKFYQQIKGNKAWFDFENPFEVKLFEDIDYDDIFQKIVQEKRLDPKKKIYIFIDEAQNFPEISKIAKYLYDHYQVKFVLTGSASYYLKNLFPESLAGRKIIFELYPLTFREYLDFKGEDLNFYDEIVHKKKKSVLDFEKYDMYYEEYLTWGGFPKVVLEKDPKIKEDILGEILASYFQKEVIILADYKKNTKIRDLITLLAARVGSKLDITRISQELATNRQTIYNYLSFLEATYFIHLLPKHSKSLDRRVSGRQKVYLCDVGLLKVLAEISSGQAFEQGVYSQLRGRQKHLAYYETPTGGEIDFILDGKEAYEAKVTGTPTDVKRLARTMKQIDLEKGWVVSKKFVENQDGIVLGQFL